VTFIFFSGISKSAQTTLI